MEAGELTAEARVADESRNRSGGHRSGDERQDEQLPCQQGDDDSCNRQGQAATDALYLSEREALDEAFGVLPQYTLGCTVGLQKSAPHPDLASGHQHHPDQRPDRLRSPHVG